MLRRYGEQALRDVSSVPDNGWQRYLLNGSIQDIRNLLQDWSDEIEQCERIFIRASVSNRRIFLDYEGAIIEKGEYDVAGYRHCR